MMFAELRGELNKCYNGIWSAAGSVREAVFNNEDDFSFILDDQRDRLVAYTKRCIALLDVGLVIPEACPDYWIENRQHLQSGLKAILATAQDTGSWQPEELKATARYLLAETVDVLGVLSIVVDSPLPKSEHFGGQASQEKAGSKNDGESDSGQNKTEPKSNAEKQPEFHVQEILKRLRVQAGKASANEKANARSYLSKARTRRAAEYAAAEKLLDSTLEIAANQMATRKTH